MMTTTMEDSRVAAGSPMAVARRSGEPTTRSGKTSLPTEKQHWLLILMQPLLQPPASVSRATDPSPSTLSDLSNSSLVGGEIARYLDVQSLGRFSSTSKQNRYEVSSEIERRKAVCILLLQKFYREMYFDRLMSGSIRACHDRSVSSSRACHNEIDRAYRHNKSVLCVLGCMQRYLITKGRKGKLRCLDEKCQPFLI